MTENETKVIDFLTRNFMKKYNINQVGRKLDLSPMGSYKILKKLEEKNIVTSQKLGNSIFYSINLDNELTVKLSELVLSQKKGGPAMETLIEDLIELKKITYSVIIFGSFIENPKKANDIDIMVLLDPKNYKKVRKEIEGINSISAKEIHPIFQTKKDLEENIEKEDQVLLDIIKTGFIIWGSHYIVGIIKVIK